MIKNADFRMTDNDGNKMYFVIVWGEAITDHQPDETVEPLPEATLYLTLVNVSSELDAKLMKANRHLSRQFASHYPELLKTCMHDLDAAITNSTFDKQIQVSHYIPHTEYKELSR